MSKSSRRDKLSWRSVIGAMLFVFPFGWIFQISTSHSVQAADQAGNNDAVQAAVTTELDTPDSTNLAAEAVHAEIVVDTVDRSNNLIIVNDFEGVLPTWSVLPSESLAAPARLSRTDRGPHNGLRCEQIAAWGNRGGEQILATHAIPPSAAIDEFRASLWLKGDRNGFQLMARVRLPRTLDERGQPLAFYVYGDSYASPGIWQQLYLEHVSDKIGDAVRALRIEKGKHVDATEAYLDQIVVNVYGAAGLNRVWIDDLGLEAAVAAPVQNRVGHGTVHLANHVVPISEGLPEDLKTAFGKRDFVARVVTHQGESFGFLKQLGFNTIWLSHAASPSQMTEARQQQLWLVCPPPDLLTADAWPRFDRVLAWDIGVKPSWNRGNTAELRKRDPAKRPTIRLDSPASTKAHSRPTCPADIVVTIPEVIELTGEVAAPFAMSDQSGTVVRDQSVHWVAIGDPLVARSRWHPLRKNIWMSVAQGCRGFVLRTAVNLQDRHFRNAANLAELTNLELSMLHPWIAGTQTERYVDEKSTKYFDCAVIDNRHASLVFVLPAERGRSTVPRWARENEIELPMSSYRDAFRFEPDGLSPVAYRRIAGGIRISLNRAKPEGLLLLTDRPTIVQATTNHLRQTWPRTSDLLVEVLRAEMLELDRRIEHTILDQVFRSHLRGELHALHGRIAPFLAGGSSATFRELDHVLGQLEIAQQSLSR